MERKWEVRFSGSGGQGIIRAAVILAQAALYDGFDATQSQSYGPESRGGSTKGEVVIDDEIIYYPKVTKPNLVLCLSKEAYLKYAADVRDGGVLVLDSFYCPEDDRVPDTVKVYRFPIVDLARDEIQNELSANVLALGIMVGLTNVVSKSAVIDSLAVNFKAKIIPVNQKAFEYGYQLAKDTLAQER